MIHELDNGDPINLPDGRSITDPDERYAFFYVLAEYQTNRYKTLRQSEYPLIQDQLDTLFHGGYEAWKSEIQAIKDKYPKGSQ